MNADTKPDTTPDPALFSINPRDGEYSARFKFSGSVTVSIKAESWADADAMARAMEEDFEALDISAQDIEQAHLQHTAETQPMFRVLRDGKAYQVSHLKPGDEPRDPDERGF